jgi:hypothetical protein
MLIGWDKIITIQAVKLVYVVRRELNPKGEFSNYSTLNISYKDYINIMWISCYNNICKDYIEEKAKNKAYPIWG